MSIILEIKINFEESVAVLHDGYQIKVLDITKLDSIVEMCNYDVVGDDSIRILRYL